METRLSDFIKPEHLAGWEHVARKNGAESVEEYARWQLDNLGVDYEAQRRDADAREQQRLFDLALALSEEARDVLKAKVFELAEAEGKLPAAEGLES